MTIIFLKDYFFIFHLLNFMPVIFNINCIANISNTVYRNYRKQLNHRNMTLFDRAFPLKVLLKEHIRKVLYERYSHLNLT